MRPCTLAATVMVAAWSCLDGVGAAASADVICQPPVPPPVPRDDALLKEYADLIEQDFQSYFDALTDFSICHDEVFARTMQEAKEVSANYRSFLARAAASGAKIAPRPVQDSPPDIQTPGTDRRDSR